MSKNLMRALCALAVLVLPGVAAARKNPADIPIETFFKRAQFSQMSLSPDGRRLAALTPLNGRNNLVIVDLDKRTREVITAFEKIDAADIYWVNSKRLCLSAVDGQVVSGEPNYKGTYCINVDGSDLRNFTTVTSAGGTQRGFIPLAPAGDDSDELIVGMRERSRRSTDVYRFNTVTGRSRLLTSDSPGDVEQWVLDRNLVPRVAVSVPERRNNDAPRIATVWHRASADAKWEKLWEYGVSWVDDDQYEPIAFDFDNQTLYVATNKGRDKAAIYAYDTKSKQMGNLLLEHPLMEVRDGLVFSQVRKKLVGVNLDADKPITVWTDPDLNRVQKAMDATLAKTVNNVHFARDNEKRALVFSHSDTDPGTYHLYDDEKKKLETIARTRDWIDPSLMAERRFITYKTRDGMEVPAWVTIPKAGGKNLPLVVNIHGGPHVRAYHWTSWSRWPEAQFFASRGYVVLEPEPRGSRGWGRKHYTSSFKQWGLTMQDDITDGALHLVKEGLVDKDRMCLHGASYGGYATLQGLVKDPDLWKCGSAFVAVTDLGLMQEIQYSDTALLSDYYEAEFPRIVGDRSKDKAQFDRTSPARNAASIKAPLLLAMGSSDVRVPLAHGDAMRGAMERENKKLEYVVYTGEGHGFNKDENVFDFYRTLEKFFADNLKK
jgi:dipeptidyl aminopeptidase/acylaminoacyl peptidase